MRFVVHCKLCGTNLVCRGRETGREKMRGHTRMHSVRHGRMVPYSFGVEGSTPELTIHVLHEPRKTLRPRNKKQSPSMIINNTPIERHTLPSGLPILVKREDLCCPYPGPSFSKMRGVMAHIAARPEPIIGVLDTFHSKGGWAVAHACKELGKQCVDFYPVFKKDRGMQYQQRQIIELGGSTVRLPAGRSAVLYHRARRELSEQDKYGAQSYMMPNALKLPESITENAAEVVRTLHSRDAGGIPGEGTLAISVSSGTVAAGVLKGFMDEGMLRYVRVLLHMGYSRPNGALRSYLYKCVPGLEAFDDRIAVVDEGYSYGDSYKGEHPVWANKYYDAKLYGWLDAFGGDLEGPVLFWNIGS